MGGGGFQGLLEGLRGILVPLAGSWCCAPHLGYSEWSEAKHGRGAPLLVRRFFLGVLGHLVICQSRQLYRAHRPAAANRLIASGIKAIFG